MCVACGEAVSTRFTIKNKLLKQLKAQKITSLSSLVSLFSSAELIGGKKIVLLAIKYCTLVFKSAANGLSHDDHKHEQYSLLFVNERSCFVVYMCVMYVRIFANAFCPVKERDEIAQC